jgi:putative spermidine/putrescine transport system substrate-binding protein
MLNRRSFLITIATTLISQWLTGCKGQSERLLKILLLQGSIPPQLIGAFRKQLASETKIDLKPISQLEELFEYLTKQQFESEKRPSNVNFPLIQPQTSTPINLITVGHYWLKQAIAEELIKPLAIEQLPSWQSLPPVWQQLVKRNATGELTSTGQIWGAPYRWGWTAIAYRRDKLEAKKLAFPTDWQDLWREDFKHYISLLDRPREIIGLTLKKLGYSYNSTNLSEIPDLKTELAKLHQQVKFYDSKNYLQPLILGDTWLAVGWSNDIIPIAKRYPNIDFIIPQSGTSLWADLWVKPVKSLDLEDELINHWIDFCWQRQGASQISLFTAAFSPVIFDLPKEELPKDLQNNLALLPDLELFEKSEVIEPLPEAIFKEYETLFLDSISII